MQTVVKKAQIKEPSAMEGGRNTVVFLMSSVSGLVMNSIQISLLPRDLVYKRFTSSLQYGSYQHCVNEMNRYTLNCLLIYTIATLFQLYDV